MADPPAQPVYSLIPQRDNNTAGPSSTSTEDHVVEMEQLASTGGLKGNKCASISTIQEYAVVNPEDKINDSVSICSITPDNSQTPVAVEPEEERPSSAIQSGLATYKRKGHLSKEQHDKLLPLYGKHLRLYRADHTTSLALVISNFVGTTLRYQNMDFEWIIYLFYIVIFFFWVMRFLSMFIWVLSCGRRILQSIKQQCNTKLPVARANSPTDLAPPESSPLNEHAEIPTKKKSVWCDIWQCGGFEIITLFYALIKNILLVTGINYTGYPGYIVSIYVIPDAVFSILAVRALPFFSHKIYLENVISPEMLCQNLIVAFLFMTYANVLSIYQSAELKAIKPDPYTGPKQPATIVPSAASFAMVVIFGLYAVFVLYRVCTKDAKYEKEKVSFVQLNLLHRARCWSCKE